MADSEIRKRALSTRMRFTCLKAQTLIFGVTWVFCLTQNVLKSAKSDTKCIPFFVHVLFFRLDGTDRFLPINP